MAALIHEQSDGLRLCVLCLFLSFKLEDDKRGLLAFCVIRLLGETIEKFVCFTEAQPEVILC